MTIRETTIASGRSGNSNGRNFGGAEEGRRNWTTGGEGSSTVCIVLRTGGPIFDRLTCFQRPYGWTLC